MIIRRSLPRYRGLALPRRVLRTGTRRSVENVENTKHNHKTNRYHDALHVAALGVAPDKRRRGLGRATLEAARRRAKSLGLPKVCGSVDPPVLEALLRPGGPLLGDYDPAAAAGVV